MPHSPLSRAGWSIVLTLLLAGPGVAAARGQEAPASTPEDGTALLYDLADALERLGEGSRALAIFLELDLDAPGYQDVPARINRLSQVQAGSRDA